MRITLLIALQITLLIALLMGSSSGMSQFGAAPADTFGARDLVAAYHLPALKDQQSDLLYGSLRNTQVLSRARVLGLTSHSATDAWSQAGETYARVEAVAPAPLPRETTVFSGTRASALNELLNRPGPCAVRVASMNLRLDTPIYPRDRCSLDLGQATLHSVGFQPYQIQIKGRSGVRLSGGHLTGGRWGVSIANSYQVSVTGMEMLDLGGGGVMVTDSNDVSVSHNRFRGLGGAAVMIHGNTVHAVVAENEMLADQGWSNWHAGIVVTDRNADPSNDSTTLLRDDGFLVKQTRITDRVSIPHDNLIYRNRIRGNRTQGIYSDGGARNLYVENAIEDNSKEGMCLDNGSTANVVAFNLFRGNGKRWGMEDLDLKRDFVMSFGRMPDGTSAAKLAGISMDNSAYNQVVFNEVDHNFGSGIKMVRTSFYNLIGLNTLTDDAEGSNGVLHYYGIWVGYAMADEPAWDLEFLPSRGNQIFANNVQGGHFAGIYFEDGADENVVFHNIVLGALKWGLDSSMRQFQQSFDNLSNLPSRNIDSGRRP